MEELLLTRTALQLADHRSPPPSPQSVSVLHFQSHENKVRYSAEKAMTTLRKLAPWPVGTLKCDHTTYSFKYCGCSCSQYEWWCEIYQPLLDNVISFLFSYPTESYGCGKKADEFEMHVEMSRLLGSKKTSTDMQEKAKARLRELAPAAR